MSPKTCLAGWALPGIVLMVALAAGYCNVAVAQPTALERAHRPLNELLKTYVVVERTFAGTSEHVVHRVRYGALKSDARWGSYVASLEHVDSVWLRAASTQDRMAFWINTYNALVIDTVVRYYPLKPPPGQSKPTILQIGDVWSQPHRVAGRSYTLQQISEQLDQLGDGRVWFLTSPAAVGGPNLRPYALTPSTIDQELESACGSFVNDGRHVRLDRDAHQLRVSDYLREHAASFVDPVRTYARGLEGYSLSERPLVDVILRRRPAEDREYIREAHPRLIYVEMDWSLNDAP